MYQEVFNCLMKLMRPFMKQQGFTSRGNNFYKRHPQGNIGIINFQRNREGFPRFTINVGIYSKVLAKFFLAEFGEKKVKENPLIMDSHWEERIGFLVPVQNPARQNDEDWRKHGDKWWNYDDTTNVEQLFNEISPLILEYGIPAINKHITDEQLKEHWLAQAESSKIHAETKTGEMRAEIESGRARTQKDLLVLLLVSGDKRSFKIVLNEFAEFTQRHPELTGLRRHYDRVIKEADLNKKEKCNTSESLNHTSVKRKNISEVKMSISDSHPKKMKP